MNAVLGILVVKGNVSDPDAAKDISTKNNYLQMINKAPSLKEGLYLQGSIVLINT